MSSGEIKPSSVWCINESVRPSGDAAADNPLIENDVISNELLPDTIREFEESTRDRYKRVVALRKAGTIDLDSLHLYVGTISCFPQVSKPQQVELARLIETGVYAQRLLRADERPPTGATTDELELIAALGKRAHLVLYLANLALVISVAKKYAKYGGVFSWLDAIQEGNILLDDAIQRFDHTCGVAFSTYARRHIDLCLKRPNAEITRTVRLPKELYDKAGRLSHELAEFEAEGHKPTAKELAERAGLSIDEVLMLLPLRHHAASLDALIGEGRDDNPTDIFVFNNAQRGAEVQASEHVRQLAAKALDALTPAERKVVTLFYGLEDASGRHVLSDIAKKLGYVSAKSAQATLVAAQQHMRRYFADQDKPKPALKHDLLKDIGIADLYGDEAYRHVLSQRVTIERAIALLGDQRAEVVNRYYGLGFDRHMTKEEVATAVGAPTVRYVVEILGKTRRELKTLIPAIADGTLDLVEWHSRNFSRRNVLVYLSRVGVSIPDDYSLFDLRVLARQHIGELPVRDDQKEILIKLYGLGEDGTTSNTVKLSNEYGRSTFAISGLENKVVRIK